MSMRDPNTGAVLRDRFHQVRGAVADGMVTDNTVQSLATQLLQSRGAPMTQQNMQMALDYLRGGNLGKFGADVSTEDAIADAAVAGTQPNYGGSAGSGGVSGGGGGGTAMPVSPTQAPSSPDNIAPGANEADAGDDGSGVLGAAAAVAGGAVAGGAAAYKMVNGKPVTPDAQGNVMVPATGRNGASRMVAIPAQSAADGGWAVVGLNYPEGGITGPRAATALPAPDNVIEGTAVDVTDTQAPNRQVGVAGEAAGGAPTGSAPATPPARGPEARRSQRGTAGPNAGPASAPPSVAGPQASGPAPDPANVPISTEEVMGAQERSDGGRVVDGPMSQARQQGGSRLVDTGQRTEGGSIIFRDSVNGGVTTRVDGEWVNYPSLDALKGAIRAIR